MQSPMLMKNLKNILFNESGNAVTILFLIMFPLFIMLTITSVSHARSVYGSDLDLQQALNDACRAAAMQVSPESQSVGDIHGVFFGERDVQEGNFYFDPMSGSIRFVKYKPYDTFNEVLERNLGLQETNGNSLTSDLEYYFIISIADPVGVLFSISNDGTNTIIVDTETSLIPELFLKDLSIKCNHDTYNPKITISGDSIGRDIVINSKGNCVIGIASMEMKPILGKARTATRWSSARIVYKDPRTIEPEDPEGE